MPSLLFYTACLGFFGGVFLQSVFYFDSVLTFFLLMVGCALYGGERILNSSGVRNYVVDTLSLAFCAVSLGMFLMHHEATYVSPLQDYEGETVSIVAQVIREPDVRERDIQLYMRPLGDDLYSKEVLLVSVNRYGFEEGQLSYGDILEVRGKVTKPEAFQTDTGRFFDYPGYLKSRGVSYQVPFAKAGIIEEEEGTSLGYLFRGKQEFVSVIEHTLPEPHAGLGEGMLLGIKRALGKDLEETFRETGIIHIVVLSGYNIMIVVECLLFALSFFFFPRTRMILGIVAIILFVLLVGPSATVVRASVMAGLLLIARGTGRMYTALRALMLAGIIMVIHNPYLLAYDPGFQLSFLATLGLILFSPHVEKRLSIIPEMVGLRTVATATIATQIAVLPLLLYQMGMVSLVSIFVNILVLPMVPIAMGLTFLTGVMGFISEIIGTAVGFITYISLEYIIIIAEFFGAFSFASVSVASIPFWAVFGMYGAITIVYIVVAKRDSVVIDDSVDEIENEYAGWIIEEEKEKPVSELRNNSSVGPFPFR
jgi:competence protein ComEC